MNQWNRLSRPEKVVAIASLVMLISLFLPWYGWSFAGLSYSVDGFNNGGWLTFLAMLAAAGFLGWRLMLRSQGQPAPALPIQPWQAYLTLGGIEVVGAVWFILATPSYSVGSGSVGPRFGVFIALVAGVATAVGGWQAKTASEIGTVSDTSSTGEGGSRRDQ